jgi:hypothetical protein
MNWSCWLWQKEARTSRDGKEEDDVAAARANGKEG